MAESKPKSKRLFAGGTSRETKCSSQKKPSVSMNQQRSHRLLGSGVTYTSGSHAAVSATARMPFPSHLQGSNERESSLGLARLPTPRRPQVACVKPQPKSQFETATAAATAVISVAKTNSTIPSQTKKMCLLLADLTLALETSLEFQIKFRRIAVHYFSKKKINGLLKRRNQALPAVEEILNSLQMLPEPSWNDANRAELIEKILRDIDMSDLAGEFEKLRITLTRKTETAPPTMMTMMQVPKPTSSMALPESSESKVEEAILIASKELGSDWTWVFRNLLPRLPDQYIDECDATSKSMLSKCYSAFRKWKEMYGSSATLGCILQGLQDADRCDTAEKIINKLHLSGYKNFLPPKDTADSEPSGASFQNSERSTSENEQSKRTEPVRKPNDHGDNGALSKVDSSFSPRVLPSVGKPADYPLPEQHDEEYTHVEKDSPPVESTAQERSIPTSSIDEVKVVINQQQIRFLNASTKTVSQEETIRWTQTVPDQCRHIQIVAVGQTGVGKTKSINRAIGTIVADEGGPGQGSVTQQITTYTRTLRVTDDGPPFQLSFTDTPGFGDSGGAFSDDEIAVGIRKAFIKDATVFMLYFDKTGNEMNFTHVRSVKKLEALTEKEISAVVFTYATWKPEFGSISKDKSIDEMFDQDHSEIEKEWSLGQKSKLKGLPREYAESKGNDLNFREFNKEGGGKELSQKKKKFILRIRSRRQHRHAKRAWYRKELERPNLRVLKIENSKEYDDSQMCQFGISQFHTKLGRLMEQKDTFLPAVFSLMTSDLACAGKLNVSAVSVGSQAEDPNSVRAQSWTSTIQHPQDTSSPATKAARKKSSEGMWRRFLNWIRRKFSKLFRGSSADSDPVNGDPPV